MDYFIIALVSIAITAVIWLGYTAYRVAVNINGG